MRVEFNPTINFKRRLNKDEESDFIDILKKGKEKIGSTGKSILIIPSASLPQSNINNTGVGNITSKEGIKFIEFAQKYWGINEIQLLPNGQYHPHNGVYPIYSGTSMDLGNHLINVKAFVSEDSFNKIVKNNEEKKKINYKNVINIDSAQEKALRELHQNLPSQMQNEFEIFKKNNRNRLEPKGIYQALREIHNTHDYKKWCEIDRNLFDDRVISDSERQIRIAEIYSQKSNTIDFYLFKQFLAEKSLKTAKEQLNSKGIKVNGDMICGFSFDEVWAHPKSFIKHCTIGWNLPALDLETEDGERLLREKVKFYAQHYDGIRIDASWTYSLQKIIDMKTGIIRRINYGDKFLKIIDDEFVKNKGLNYNYTNIMHEFAADANDFNMYAGNDLKPFVNSRNKIFTSDYLSYDWGNNYNYLKRGWNKKFFILGARNHDSQPFKISQEQVEALSKILKIPREKLQNKNEFIRAKLAEPFSAYNNMIFFMDALGLNGEYKQNSNKTLDYTAKIPADYEKYYFNGLEIGRGFNPMDALEKNFKAKGLDKTESKLYKKIVKYKNILEGKEAQTNVLLKIVIGIACASLVLYGIFKYYKYQSSSK